MTFDTTDKAVSAGERSIIIIKDAKIINAKFGFVSKDNSYLNVNNSTLENTFSGFAAYNKKPEFSGADIFVEKTIFNNNQHNFLSEKGSKIYLDNKLILNNNEFDYKNF